MNKLLLIIGSFVLGSVAYAGGSGKVLANTDECKWVQQGECKTECPACAKATTCPKAKVCPKAKTKTVVKWKTKQKTQYVNVPVEKVVYVAETKPTHTFGVLGGLGPNGGVVDYYETEDRPNEYVFRKGTGSLIGLQYQLRISSWSLSATVLSNSTMLGGIHFSK